MAIINTVIVQPVMLICSHHICTFSLDGQNYVNNSAKNINSRLCLFWFLTVTFCIKNMFIKLAIFEVIFCGAVALD